MRASASRSRTIVQAAGRFWSQRAEELAAVLWPNFDAVRQAAGASILRGFLEEDSNRAHGEGVRTGLDIAVTIIERAADAGIGSVAEIVAAIRAARNERG